MRSRIKKLFNLLKRKPKRKTGMTMLHDEIIVTDEKAFLKYIKYMGSNPLR